MKKSTIPGMTRYSSVKDALKGIRSEMLKLHDQVFNRMQAGISARQSEQNLSNAQRSSFIKRGEK